MKEKQVNPDFEKIIPLCIRELNIKFADYGNSWMKCDKDYWVERIANEIDEYKKSMTPQSEKRKMLNIINMAGMAWSVTK